MTSLTTSNKPGYIMQQVLSGRTPSTGIPTVGAIGKPSFQSKLTNVPSHNPDSLQSHMLHIHPNGQASPTSRSCFSTALLTQTGSANMQNVADFPSNQYGEQNDYVTGVQHMSLNQLTKLPGTYPNNQEFTTSSNENHFFQSLQQTCNIPLAVPSDVQPMEMRMNCQQSVSFPSIMNQTGFANASVFGTDVTRQRQPFVHSKTPDSQNWWSTESDFCLQIEQNHSLGQQHQQKVQNKYQAQQQREAHTQKQHQIQNLMNQTLPDHLLIQLKQSAQVGQKLQRSVQTQQPLHLRQPNPPLGPVQHYSPVHPLQPVQLHQQVQPFQQVQRHQPLQRPQQVRLQVPDPLHHPSQIHQPEKFLSRLQLCQKLQLNQGFPFHQLQPHHHPAPANMPNSVQQSAKLQQPGQLHQLEQLQTPVGQTQNPHVIFPSMNNDSCLRDLLTTDTTHKSAFASVNTGNINASFNESLNRSNGILSFANNEDFVRPYPSVGVMGSQRHNIHQVELASTNVSMHSPNFPAGISTLTSSNMCSTVVNMDALQIPMGQPIHSAAHLSGSENNVVTKEDLSKIQSEIIKSQQNTLNLQRAYESQKRALCVTNCYTNVSSSSVEGSLVSLNSLHDGYSLNGEQVTPCISTNSQSLSDTSRTNLPKAPSSLSFAESLNKCQSMQDIFAELADFASQYESHANSFCSEQNKAVGSKPEILKQSNPPILSQEQGNISPTPFGHNEITNQYLPTGQPSTSATSQQHCVLDGELIAISNEQISNSSASLTPLLTRTSPISKSVQPSNAVNCGNTNIEEVTNNLNTCSSAPNDPICKNVTAVNNSHISTLSAEPKSKEELYPCHATQKSSTPNADGMMKQCGRTIAQGTSYLNPPSSAVNAFICKNITTLTDSPISAPSAVNKSEVMLYPCLAMQTSFTSSTDGTMKQHSSINADQTLCNASGVDFLKKETQEVQISESIGSAMTGSEVERPAVTVARYANDTVSFNVMKAVEPQVAIVNPLRVLKPKSPCKDQDAELSKIEPTQGNHFVVENAQKLIGDVASTVNHAERGIEIVSPSFNHHTHFGTLSCHTESSKNGEATGGYGCKDVNESFINQSTEEIKLTINERNCDSTVQKNSKQPYAPNDQDLILADASGIPLDDGNLLISSFCTLVEGNMFYDPQIAKIVDAIPTVHSMSAKESHARNDILQIVGALELTTVNQSSPTETAPPDLKYLAQSKIGSCLDQDPSSSNEQGIEGNVDHTNANVSRPNAVDFLSEPNASAKQTVLDTWNKKNESAGFEKNVDQVSNLPNVVTVNSTVCEINKSEGQVLFTSDSVNVDSPVEQNVDSPVEQPMLATTTAKLYYEDPPTMKRGTKNCAGMADDQGNLDYSCNNSSPNAEVEHDGHNVVYYDDHTAFETDQMQEDGVSTNFMLSAQTLNDQLSELLREFPYGLDTIGRKDSFEKMHSALNMDVQLSKPGTFLPLGCLESDYQIPLNELPSKSEFSTDQMLTKVDGKEGKNYLCEKKQTLKLGLVYGKSAANDNFCVSSSNIGDDENNSINETQMPTVDTEQTHRFKILPLSGIEANMECDQNPNLLKTESTNAVSSSENKCIPSEGMEIDYQTSDNLRLYFHDSFTPVFPNGQPVLCSAPLDKGPSIDKPTECGMISSTSVEESPAKDIIDLKKAVLSIPEDNDLKRRNIFAQSSQGKRTKMDFKERPLKTVQKLMAGKPFHLTNETTSHNKSVKPKSEHKCIKSRSIHTRKFQRTIKCKGTKFEVDQQNEVSPVRNGRLTESDRDFLNSEIFEDSVNPGKLDRKAQNIKRLIVKMDFSKISKASCGILKGKVKKHCGSAPGADVFKKNHKKLKKATPITRTEKGTLPSNNLCALDEKILYNSKTNCKLPALKICVEKPPVPYEKRFNGEKPCIIEENEYNSVPVKVPNLSKCNCSRCHKANFVQYKKRIQTIQEYRRHQKEQAKELEGIIEGNVSEPTKLQQSGGKTKIQVHERNKSNISNGICLGENMHTSLNSSESVMKQGKDTATVEDAVSKPKTPHQPEGKVQIQVLDRKESSNNSDRRFYGENMHTYITSSESVTQTDKDMVKMEDDVAKANLPSKPENQTQIKVLESSRNVNGFCLDENVNHASKFGNNKKIVNKEVVSCLMDSLSAVVSTESNTRYLNTAAFKNKTCETICLMILGSSSSTKSSIEISPQKSLESIVPINPRLVVPKSHAGTINMVDSSVCLRCLSPDEDSTSSKT